MTKGSDTGIYIGLMSGTSMDAIDTVLVDFNNKNPVVIDYEQYPISEQIKSTVRLINLSSSIEEVTELDAVMGHVFADAVNSIVTQSGVTPDEITAIGSHGQTVLHLPSETHPRTLQIGDPNIIANKTGITTIADFRRMDMASGGQGAPLAPAFHESVFRNTVSDRIVLNIGGIANITVLPSDSTLNISGFDTGPGNGLLDDWNQKHNSTPMDRDSAWAMTGKSNDMLLASFLSDEFFSLPAPKSTGRDHFNLNWVERHLGPNSKLAAADIQATLLSLTVENIAMSIEQTSVSEAEIYACGGGAQNAKLMAKLRDRLPRCDLQTTDALNLNPDAIEAIAFAWLARQTFKTMTGSNHFVTGAAKPEILGGIYQASGH